MKTEIDYEKVFFEALVLFMVGLAFTLIIASFFDISFQIPQVDAVFHSIRDGLQNAAVYAAGYLAPFAIFGAMIVMGSASRNILISIFKKLGPWVNALYNLIKKEMKDNEEQEVD